MRYFRIFSNFVKKLPLCVFVRSSNLSFEFMFFRNYNSCEFVLIIRHQKDFSNLVPG